MSESLTLPFEAAEQWRPVVGYEGLYEISDLGRVWSIPRKDGLGRTCGGIFLTPDTHGAYPSVALRSGKKRTARIHVLIAAAFIGPRPEGQQVRHLDGNKANSVLANLAYGTLIENAQDALRHGVNYNAAKTHCPQGHPYDEANTYWQSKGGRICRACSALRSLERRRNEPSSPRRPGAPKTHCKRGHKFTPENTYVAPDRKRQCRICRRRTDARRRERQEQVAA